MMFSTLLLFVWNLLAMTPGRTVFFLEYRHKDLDMEKELEELMMKKLITVLFLISLGCWIGIHRNVIKAWITGSDMPEAPVSHCWLKK